MPASLIRRHQLCVLEVRFLADAAGRMGAPFTLLASIYVEDLPTVRQSKNTGIQQPWL